MPLPCVCFVWRGDFSNWVAPSDSRAILAKHRGYFSPWEGEFSGRLTFGAGFLQNLQFKNYYFLLILFPLLRGIAL